MDTDPESNIRIASFDRRLSMMSSMRRPKKLIIIGSDQRAYPFLFKVFSLSAFSLARTLSISLCLCLCLCLCLSLSISLSDQSDCFC